MKGNGSLSREKRERMHWKPTSVLWDFILDEEIEAINVKAGVKSSEYVFLFID